ncbi:TPA: penicillin-binding protein PBP2B [Streptococcus pneumoniae]|uniref:penicillin-binding protein PBP2B n=1 Tax=Streptococcus pneumoniae TaxID=1313 RepID=UPI000990E313|nr:penicillin-binding protein PBP2B [Streptococcus pneumoniae]WDT20018.1 penicillin-binding protein PBP2B [Streptococcus pneumoniae]WDT22183.1 penicillin-binding protein PBP2B [Streptococcus pneumoniae]HET1003542.1 penicillin-binding protein 2 [Streptococcus pneumoniae]HET4434933.1 penicillin-binding protein 2 [Streptococcus pneumoniae]HET5390544.1 penicillin-binding protein 2 [Streptococcus pneumoniae]
MRLICMRKFNSHSIPIRLNLLFSIVILLFMTIIGRLLYMQVLNKDFYEKKLASASQTKVTTSSARGEIYDASGKPLVENTLKQVVSFTRSNKMTATDLKEIAKKLLTYVSISSPNLTERQLADYYLADPEIYKKTVEALPSEKRLDSDGNRLSESELYNNAVDSVPTSQLNYTEDEKKEIYLFSQLNAVGNFATGTIATDPLNDSQVAVIASISKEMPGISISTSWDRKILETSLSSIVGSVSSEKAGLPAEEAEAYLKKGYSLNDRVGTSYLEKQYEETLQGKRSVKEIHLDKYGNMESVDTIEEGSKGNNIKLTIDLAFQDSVDALLKSYFNSELGNGGAKYSEGVYAVALNPKTGAVLSMSGLKHDLKTGELTPDSLGTVTNVFVPGSVVKAATISSGWENGVLSGNQTLTDQPIVFQGSAPIYSWYKLAYGSFPITAVEALEYSSNAYVVQTALGIMGQTYQPNMFVGTSNLESAMGKLRSTFGEYGLGSATGIDLPDESTGLVPKEYNFANFITNAFGQFDNYTPMQLAQYVATIANNGVRLAPHIVEGIYDNNDKGGLGELIQAIDTKEINKVNISESDMAILHQGFYQVSHGTSPLTTGRAFSDGATVSISGKTGTGESYVAGGQEANNTNAVAYAPTENPQIAVAVVFPHNTNLTKNVGPAIARDIINLYNQHHPMN